MSKGFVYFIGCHGSRDELRVKIGYTGRHPLDRLMDFQPGSPEELDVLCYIPGDHALERRLHVTFAGCRVHNEWFVPFGLMSRLMGRLMTVGNGAREPTPYSLFKQAFFETVYDWAPSPDVDEDFQLLIESADPSNWDHEFADILAERLAAHRKAREAKE